MRTYLYFRDVTNEDADDDRSASITIPADKVTGIVIQSTTELDLFFQQEGKRQPTKVRFVCRTNSIREAMRDICRAMNAGPHEPGLQIISDAVTTTDGATSIQGNDKTVQEKYVSRDITGVSIIGADV